MKKLALLLLGALCALPLQARDTRPRLVVQIVVGSMRAEDLDRYAAHFGEGGFRRLMEGGARYTGARYDYQQTSTPVSLATLTTGAMPSTHGVIGSRWQDYTDNRTVWLTDGRQGPGPYHLIAPTLGETLLRQSPESRCATVAAEAESAVVMGGRTSEVYWLDPQHGGWTTSYYYAPELPEWIARDNRQHYNLSYLVGDWRTLYDRNSYRNTRHWDIFLSGPSRKGGGTAGAGRLVLAGDYERLLYTPAGNTAVLDFAKQLIVRCRLGGDAVPDLLNICLDSSRRISEAYGPESIEVEDMFCRLDRDLADFLTFLFAQVEERDVLVILASDHGTSPSYDLVAPAADRFNARQFEVIVNGFLNVRYGAGDWVTDCHENSIWLNHNLIYERGLNLADVQNEVAIFAMQFGGVSHALAATAMRTSYFGSGYARRLQNSFYPRRSGDVVFNLMPGWIGERERCHSSSGSMYGYDTDVPLLFYGAGIGPQRIRRHVDMTSVAPTAARFLEISEPAASEGETLEEIIE
ncbi:MAG: alkaline phosphatase family protein [Alistipes sp.]|nr:alkaline phosphatase family protein [Alistipes senegalensis]MCM1250880.1 alkaline phosphatase family protein [Alistipes sp.]